MTGRYHDPDARELDAQPEAACQAPPAVSH